MSVQQNKIAAFGQSQTGLTTVGYRLVTSAGTVGSRVTSGVYEVGGGAYGALVTFPDAFIGTLRWDSGGSPLRYASEAIDLTAYLGGIASAIDAIAQKLAGMTSLPRWLRALFRKDVADAVAMSEINVGGGGYATATDSAEAQGDALAGLSPTPGAFTMTVTVTNSVTTLAIEGARVTYSQAGVAIQTGQTNASGVSAIGLNAGTYIRTITASGYTSSSATVVVTAGTSVGIQLTANTVTPATDPGQTNAYVTCYDATGAVDAGVVVTIELEKLDYSNTGTGHGFSSAPSVGTSGNDGVAMIVIPRGSALRFKARRGTGTWFPFAGVDSGSLQLPDLVGRE